MMTRVYLIRHGETEGADSRRYKGHIDVPLSENGIEQIKRVAEYIDKEGSKWLMVAQNISRLNNIEQSLSNIKQTMLSAVYCSDLSRAIMSAEIIAAPFGLKPVTVKGLKERSFGVWEGMSFDEIKEKWPDAFNAWAADPLKFSPMDGESTIEVRDRVIKAFEEIMKNHNGQNIAIVSHGGVIRVLLCEMLGMPLENIFRIEQSFAALNVIEMWDYPVVKLINFIA
ncbi:MAG: histidine phosphatase family protein [Nitrospirae bacterium]|nr:histidine phosphatase family protein [Nitrospirota bacterium]